MDKEKILYHAKHNNGFTIRSCDYQGKVAENLDYLIKHKMITWLTNELWEEYSSCGQQSLYDQAIHEYKITKDGEVLLSIFRMAYTHKNHLNEEKHSRRINEFFHLLSESGRDSQYFETFLTKNQKKALEHALTRLDRKQKWTELFEQEISPYNIDREWLDQAIVVNPEDINLVEPELDPWNIAYVHLGIPQERIDAIDLDEPLLKSMFNMSVGLGYNKTNSTRTEDYVLRKINEELGEMTLEMNIRDGLSYKDAGADGVKGEAVDLAICAMDMFALQCSGMSPEEMEREFLTYMIVKLNKWRDTLK